MKDAFLNDETLTIEMRYDYIAVDNLDEEDLETLAGFVDENDTVVGIWDYEYSIINEAGEVIGGVIRLGEPVRLSFEIPEEMREAAEGYTRRFYVIRYHIDHIEGDEIERLEADFDGESVTIENDKFSFFIVTYQDEAVVETPNTGTFTEVADYAQKHGRISVMVLSLGMMILGYGLIALGKQYQD